ncbi:MAG: ABC transporter permease [Verrucomicrobia bacterium]|nr:ABC transporter permease [Cytophagales bacterium]
MKTQIKKFLFGGWGAMLRSYLTIMLRNITRQPLYTFINITGLSFGLMACWFLTVYVLHEQQYDTFLPDANRICAVALHLKQGDTEGTTTNTPPALGIRLASDYPEIETLARVFNLGETLVTYKKQGKETISFNESKAIAVDSTFLKLFSFEMKQGDANALNKPQSVVLTEKMARKYFGNEMAMGQTIAFNRRMFTVNGIVKDLPVNSSVQFDFLLPTKDFRVVERFAWSWIWLQMDTWVKFKQPLTKETLAKFEAKLPEMVKKYAPETFARVGQNFEEQIKKGDKYNVRLLPLTQLHLNYADIDSRLITLGDAKLVQLFVIIGIVILLLACVNFVNLSTARSMKRAKEVGIRKTLGSSRSSLIGQFLMESCIIILLSFVFSAHLTGIIFPVIKQIIGIKINAQ